MPDTLTARERFNMKYYGGIESPVQLAIKNGGTVAEHKDTVIKNKAKDSVSTNNYLSPLQPKPQATDYSIIPNIQKPILQKSINTYKQHLNEGEVKALDDSAKKWLKDWYSKRNNIESGYRSNAAINIANRNLTNAGESFADKMGFIAGQYFPLENEVRYRAGINNDIRIHELTHARDRVSQLFNDGNVGKINDILKDGNFKSANPSVHKYWDKPLEINARLNQFRYNLGVKPDEVIDQKRLDELIYGPNSVGIKKSPGNSNDKWLNRYNDKTKIRLLNEVAQNNQLQSINSLYTKPLTT